MCFSAKASFAAAAVIGTTGVLTIKKAKKKKELLFASIPLLFAIQQLSEGIIWLSPANSISAKLMTYTFLFFALVIWPTYTPLAVISIEPDKKRRKIIRMLLFVGIIISITLLLLLIFFPTTYSIKNENIQYKIVALAIDQYIKYMGLGLYGLTTIGSCLLSSHKIIRIFGIMLTLSLAVSLFFFLKTYQSVWCFFAAALSLMIYLHFRKKS